MISNFKKRKTKKIMKSIKSIDSFCDIKEIYNNGIELKDGTFVIGIKVSPFDIWTADDVQARHLLSNLRYAYNVINFPVYQAMVYIPSSFESLENSLLNELEMMNEPQKEIILDDLDKIDEFSKKNKKLEFFLLIKEKNLKKLQRNFEILKTEFERSFITNDLYYLDYINYINWLFDVEDTLLTKAFFKGNTLFEEETQKIDINIEEETQKIDINIEEENEKEHKNNVFYNLYEFQEKKEYFTMNGINYSLILVKGLPSQFNVGLFNYTARNQEIKMFIKSQNSELDLINHVRKEYRNLEEIYKKAMLEKNVVQADELYNKIISLKEYSQEMALNRDKTLDISLAFVVSHYDYKEMNYIKKNFIQTLRNMGFSLFSPKMIQGSLFKYFNPIFSHDKLLNNTQRFNIGFPLGTNSYALTYPYHYSTNEDENGFLYGFERNMRGRIVFNPYLYKDNPSYAVKENRLGGNIIIMGEIGSGKSTDLFLIIRYLIRRKTFIMWIDPENKNKKYTLKKGGIYLEFGSDKFMFNVWNLTRISSDEEDNEVIMFEEMWNTEQAIINAIDTFKNVLNLYCKQIDDKSLNVVGMIAKRMYARKNITPETMRTFEHLKNTDFPIMQDFVIELQNLKKEFVKSGNVNFISACEDLLIKITPMVEEHKFLFNGHTTHNIEIIPGQIIGIGTKKLYLKDQNVQDALYHIIYSQAFNYCLDDKVDSAFIYDEAHTTMKKDQTIDLLDQLTRRSRKYKNLTILGTQEPLDLNKPNMLSILNNSTYIIAKMLTKDNALKTLQSMIGIADEDLENIKMFSQGDSYFKCGKKTYYMHTLLSDKENVDKGNNY